MKKLKALGSNHKDLEMVIAELQSLKKTLKHFQSINESVQTHQKKWADNEGGSNEADITVQTSELHQNFGSALEDYATELRRTRQHFETILQHSKQLDQLESKIKETKSKEKSARKKSQSSDSDNYASQSDLRQIETNLNSMNEERLLISTTLAESRVKDLKAALITSSDAHIHLANQMVIIFTAQKELARLLPDSDDYSRKHSTSGSSDQIVKDAKIRLSVYKERQMLSNGDDRPVPPVHSRPSSQNPPNKSFMPSASSSQPSAPSYQAAYQPSYHHQQQTGHNFMPVYSNQLAYRPQGGYIPVNAIPVTFNPATNSATPVFYLQQQPQYPQPPPGYNPDYNGSMSSSSKSSRSATIAHSTEQPYTGHISMANHKPPDFPPPSAEPPPIKSRSRSLTKSFRKKFSGKSKSSSNLSKY